MPNSSMKITDLKEADVLLFSASPDCISTLAAKLTNSDISHSALSYRQGSEQVIHAREPFVTVDSALGVFAGRTIYVMRDSRNQSSHKSVLDIADQYKSNQVPFAVTNLFLLSMILLNLRINPSNIFQTIATNILKSVIAAYTEFQTMRTDKKPVVCSQFVYECFQQAGNEFAFTTLGPLIAAFDSSAHKASILERVMEKKNFGTQTPLVSRELVASMEDKWENLAESASCKLLTMLNFQEAAGSDLSMIVSNSFQDDSADLDDEFSTAVANLAVLTNGSWGPNANSATSMSLNEVEDALNRLRANQSLFITPADLRHNIPELKIVGQIVSS